MRRRSGRLLAWSLGARMALAVGVSALPASATAAGPAATPEASAASDAPETSSTLTDDLLPVPIVFEECATVRREEVRRIVGVELRGRAGEHLGEVDPDARGVRVLVRCLPPGSDVRIEVTRPAAGKVVDRTIDIAALGAAASARLLALTVAELVSAQSGGASAGGALSNEPAPPGSDLRRDATAPALSRPRDRAAPGLSLGGEASVRDFTSGVGVLFGGAARLTAELDHGLAFTAAAGFERGGRDFAAGTVSIDDVSLDAGLTMGRWLGRMLVCVGAGARGGAARFAGAPAAATVAGATWWARWAGPEVMAAVRVRAGRLLVVGLAADGGYGFAAAKARVAPSAEELSFGGLWAGLALNVGVSP